MRSSVDVGGLGLSSRVHGIDLDAARTTVAHHRLEDMRGGWVVGDFVPAVLRTAAVEVAVKHIAEGTREARHVHRVATEVTIVASGRVMLADREWSTGDIVVIPPDAASSFEALTDCLLVVVKAPSVVGDKHPSP